MAEKVLDFTLGDLSEVGGVDLSESRGEFMAEKVFGFTGGDLSELKGLECPKVSDSLGLLDRTSFGLTEETDGNDADGLPECLLVVGGTSFILNGEIALSTEPTIA